MSQSGTVDVDTVSQRGAAARGAGIRTSIVILTYARDDTLKATLSHLRQLIGPRPDTEIVLVDNNPDSIDRADFLADFSASQVVKTGGNKGVFARNFGMEAARGETIVLLDDDVLVQTADFLDRFGQIFSERPEVGLVMIRKLDAKTMTQLPECVPHTDKGVDATKPFLTFRFVGGLVALRKAVFRKSGGFSPEFFFGQEELEYSYRLIKDGWKILYEPSIVAIETNAGGGRRDRFEVQTDVLRNRYMIVFLHLPLLAMIVHVILFTGFLYIGEKGRISIPRAIGDFAAWLRTPGRARRRPIDRATQSYIRACGGKVWR